jgi:hypothetical protein
MSQLDGKDEKLSLLKFERNRLHRFRPDGKDEKFSYSGIGQLGISAETTPDVNLGTLFKILELA